jgi:hypothetical protein
MANQGGVLQFIKALPPWISVGTAAAFGVIAFAAWTREWPFKVLFGLVLAQGLLIAWFLPHDLRFLGGLHYVVLVMATWVLRKSPFVAFSARRWWVVFVALCLPWLALQIYYAKPFVKVLLGTTSRSSFTREYVAFTDDFRALDHILPKEAVIYVVNSRLPSYYAPRPLIFTLKDLRGRGPLYRLTVGSGAHHDNSLACGAAVYENPRAFSVVFRAPGRAPQREPLSVERCFVNRGE